jgi:predicted PurR-regulated permease PerM
VGEEETAVAKDQRGVGRERFGADGRGGGQLPARHASAREYPDFTHRVLIVVAIVTAVLLLLTFLWYAIDVVLLAFTGLLLAVLLRDLTILLHKHTPLSEGWALTVVVLAIIGLIGSGVWFLGPQVAVQFDEFVTRVPEAAQQVAERIGQSRLGQQFLNQTPSSNEMLPSSSGVVSSLTGFFSRGLGMLANIVIVVAMALYLAANPDLYRRGLIRLFPPRYRHRMDQVLHATSHTLRSWLIGQGSSMLIVSSLTTAGLSLIGVPLALMLGLLAGLMEFVPNFGPMLASIPALLMASSQGTSQLLYVALLYMVLQLVESYLITPLIQQQVVEVPPALLIATQLLMGTLFGGLGLFLAAPFLAVTLTLVKMLYIEDILNEPIDVPGEHDGDG